MGRRQKLTKNERGQIAVLAAPKCTKREMAQCIRRSVHAITTYLQDQQQYGKKNKGKHAALTVKDHCWSEMFIVMIGVIILSTS